MQFLANKPGKPVTQDIELVYNRLKWRALFGIFIGYAAYYIIRNNFLLSSPYLVQNYGFTKTDIGALNAAMLVVYGLSKGVMSSLADKSNPKHFMMFGLVLSALVNIMMGFSTAFWMFAGLVMLNGVFQGMGAGPAYVVLASWFPRKARGINTAIFNISHNVGGGLIAPISGAALAWLGEADWQTAKFVVPAFVALLVVVVWWFVGCGRTENEGLPPVTQILKSEQEELVVAKEDISDKSVWYILRNYIFNDPKVWIVSFIDVFTYLIRFGVLTWLPLYLLETKGFTKGQMSAAFAIFEWAAIPTTLFAGYITDTYFKGRRMPLAIYCLIGIAFAMWLYWSGSSLGMVTLGAGIIGGLIYVPMFLSSLQCIEMVPSFAAGSATGLRGLLSYILGSVSGTWLVGWLASNYGWGAGFAVIFGAVLMCILCCWLTHLAVLKLEAEHAVRQAN